MKSLSGRITPPLFTFIGVVGLLEILARNGIVHEFIFPAPLQVVKAFFHERTTLSEAASSTFYCAVAGYLLSAFAGVILAVLFSFSDFLRRAVFPYAVFLQTVPIISIAPMLVIWFGFGHPTVIASSFIVSLFPVIASTLLGIQSTDPQLSELFQLYEAKGKDRLFKLRLPSALPQIFSGLRIAGGLSIVGTIVGEFIAGGGLGGVVDAARTQQRLDLVFAAVLLSSTLGLAMIVAINTLSRLTLWKWHASEQSKN